MCLITAHAHALKRIGELEAALATQDSNVAELKEDITDLLEQLALGLEKPSSPDIVKSSAIIAYNAKHKLEVDFNQLNIPFTKPPRLLVMDIPDTNSMDGLFDYGHNNLYLQPADDKNHKIMVDWIADQFTTSNGLLAADVVYRIMTNSSDSPSDFSKPHLWYAIHRLVEVGADSSGRLFYFAGINNPVRDPYAARDHNILWLNIGTIF